MSAEEKLLRLENALTTLVELSQKSDERMAKIEESQANAENLIGRLAAVTTAGFQDINEKIGVLVDSHTRLLDSQAKLTESQAHTDKQLTETNERLNILIGVVERYFSEGRNGKS